MTMGTDMAALEGRIAQLEAALDELGSKRAITDVLHLYCRGIDRMDAQLLTATFHDDAEVDYGPSFYRGNARGFVPLALSFLQMLRDSQHHLSNINIELDGNVAYVESYVNAHHVMSSDSGPREFTVGARYLDRFERRAGTWRIASRREVYEWVREIAANEQWFAANPGQYRGTRSREDFVYHLRR